MVLIAIGFETMVKIATLLFLLFVPLIMIGSAGRIVTPAAAQVTATPTPPAKATDDGWETAVGIKALTLSAEDLSRECDPIWNELTVDVSARSDSPDERQLKYRYIVDGGKIIGEGPNVKWDLTDANQGTYRITAAVDDGCGFCGNTVTKMVTVTNVSNCECDCPELMVDGSYDGVRPGDELEFSAELLGKQVAVPTYNWTVENGKIISGQGTDEITVLTDAKSQTGAVTATVQIPPFDTYCNCPTTGTASVPFAEHSIIIDVNQFAFVENLILDETELTLPPSPGQRPFEGTKVSPDMLIGVTTVATDPENDPLTYSYDVSGGRIIGKGAKVMWDLSGVEPGTYRITAGVDDGCGICGKTVTKYVKVVPCPIGISDVDCPELSVKAPPSIGDSTNIVFTALASGGGQPGDLTYTWSVENAEVIDGQNTPVVTIRTPENAADTKVIVKLSVRGIPEDWNCIHELTKTYENGHLIND